MITCNAPWDSVKSKVDTENRRVVYLRHETDIKPIMRAFRKEKEAMENDRPRYFKELVNLLKYVRKQRDEDI